MRIHKDINKEMFSFQGQNHFEGKEGLFLNDVQDMFVLKHQKNLLS